MVSINPSGKRRRLDAASTLSKPFKSPLRRAVPASGETDESIKREGSLSSVTTPQRNTTSDNPTNKNIATSTPNSSAPSISSPVTNSQTRKRKSMNTPTPTRKSIFSDPALLDLQKQQRNLQSRLATLRSELDTVQQALRIESSSKDVELEKLIAKWKHVSQDSAEEVFTGAQERVSGMGGMAAWREGMNRRNSRWEHEEMQSWYGNEEAAEGEVDEDELESRRAEMLDQLDIPLETEETEKKRDEGTDDEEFTMDIMLKTLNIDLHIIGYDKSDQRWIKD